MSNDPATFAELKTSLANWTNRSDLSTTEIPEAIALAERRFQRLVKCPERTASDTLTTSTGSVALPTDLWALNMVYLDADRVLQRLTPGELRAWYPERTGTPEHFAVEGQTLLLGPAPSSSTDIEVVYEQTIPALNDSNTTNWLLTDHPDVYLWGALSELHGLLADFENASFFEDKMRTALADINQSGSKRTINSGPLTASAAVRQVRNIRA